MVCVLILDIDSIVNHFAVFLGTLLMFAFPFISINYLISFIFDKAETAFKWTIPIFLSQYVFSTSIIALFGTASTDSGDNLGTLSYVCEALFPLYSLNNSVVDILKVEVGAPYPMVIYARFGLYIFQAAVYIFIAIQIDSRMIHSFIGKDGAMQTMNRTQLEERQDVIDHKN